MANTLLTGIDEVELGKMHLLCYPYCAGKTIEMNRTVKIDTWKYNCGKNIFSSYLSSILYPLVPISTCRKIVQKVVSCIFLPWCSLLRFLCSLVQRDDVGTVSSEFNISVHKHLK